MASEILPGLTVMEALNTCLLYTSLRTWHGRICRTSSWRHRIWLEIRRTFPQYSQRRSRRSSSLCWNLKSKRIYPVSYTHPIAVIIVGLLFILDIKVKKPQNPVRILLVAVVALALAKMFRLDVYKRQILEDCYISILPDRDRKSYVFSTIWKKMLILD